MLNRFAKSSCNLMVLGVALTLPVPALAGPTPTPSATPSSTPTASPTLPPPPPSSTPTATPTFPLPSPTPTATPTASPVPLCGNGVLDPGEQCDPPLTPEGAAQCSGFDNVCLGEEPFGPPCTCTHVDLWYCEIDKKCSVGGSAPADQCAANPGDEVTYHYIVGPVSAYEARVEVTDDKLGVVANDLVVPILGKVEFTVTTTIFHTTTNTAWISAVSSAACVIPSESDSVTVTVAGVPTPTSTPTATPTMAPTPTPTACVQEWGMRTFYTIGKGQSAANNAKVVHQITGHIVDPDGLCPSSGPCNASRIPVCAGTGVYIAVTDSTGAPTSTNIGKGDISCVGSVCRVGAINVTEKYKSVSADGKDTDRITLLPK